MTDQITQLERQLAEARAEIERLREELGARPPQREGWVMVPEQPTWEMLEAAKNGVILSPSLDALMKKGLRANWRDMVRAAIQGDAS